MNRHYYLCDDLNELEKVELELETAGIDVEQIHVLSDDDAFLQTHKMPSVDSISKKDVVQSGIIGLLVGLLGAAVILLSAIQFGINEQFTWAPAMFMSAAFLGFCTWEGGLWGIQKPNRDFAKFQTMLREGKHLFFVDLRPEQEPILQDVTGKHQALHSAGTGDARPEWMVGAHKNINKFVKWAP